MKTPQSIISDASIEAVHGHANFGDMSKRRVVDEGVLKYALGFQTGHTQMQILKEHGLIKQRRKAQTTAASLSPKGKRYLRAMTDPTSIDMLLTAMGR
jgi:predicted transcriptional regulator